MGSPTASRRTQGEKLQEMGQGIVSHDSEHAGGFEYEITVFSNGDLTQMNGPENPVRVTVAI